MKTFQNMMKLFLLLSVIDHDPVHAEIKSRNTCSGTERWTLDDSIPVDSQKKFRQFLTGKINPIQSFSESLFLRRISSNFKTRLFAEYWLARSLHKADMIHMAFPGFSIISSVPTNESTASIQVAAIDCINQIYSKYPSFELAEKIQFNLAILNKLPLSPQSQKIVNQMAFNLFIQKLSRSTNSKNLNKLLSNINKKTDHFQIARGFYLIKKGRYREASDHLKPLLAVEKKLPHSLKKYQDTIRVVTSRSDYSAGQFESSIQHLLQVSKSSNELSHALSELSWAYLMSEQYSSAIGTAINLQSGGLRRTFTPEAQMVMAMAFNEICHYPRSLKSIDIFKREYKAPYQWLSSWKKSKNKKLYPEAISFLEKNSTIPERIASEWVRSPLFITRQDEINAIFKQQSIQKKLGKMGEKTQLKLAKNLLRFAVPLKKRYQLAKLKLKPGEKLPKSITQDLEKLKSLVATYNRMRSAAPYWRRVLNYNKVQSEKRKTTLVSQINRDLKNITERMFYQLEEVAENNQLIEVEIFNGATKDIIWQNAHPGYEKVAKNLDKKGKGSDVSETWSWGNVSGGLDGSGEIWEDELGSFKADLYDNCKSKDRYLALKKSGV